MSDQPSPTTMRAATCIALAGQAEQPDGDRRLPLRWGGAAHSEADGERRNDDVSVVDRQSGKARTHFTIHSLTGAITAL